MRIKEIMQDWKDKLHPKKEAEPTPELKKLLELSDAADYTCAIYPEERGEIFIEDPDETQWFCACGQSNAMRRSICAKCGKSRDEVLG